MGTVCSGPRLNEFSGMDHDSRVDALFRALDEDKDNVVSRAEIIEWIKDERYLNTPMWQDGSLKNACEDLLRRIDVNGDDQITREELAEFLSNISSEQLEQMTQSLVRFGDDARERIIKRIFTALDTDRSGTVDRDEVLFWLNNERSWKDFEVGDGEQRKKLNARGRQAIYEKMDADGDGKVTYEELKQFFSDWQLRDLRLFTEDQMYYDQLAQYTMDPTEEERRRLKRLKEDRKWERKMRGERSSKSKKSKKDKRRGKSRSKNKRRSKSSKKRRG